MNDWMAFVESVPWFLESKSDVRVLESSSGVQLPPSVAAVFPTLTELLAKSTVTSVYVNNDNYLVLGWDTADCHRFGWLCSPPIRQPVEGGYPIHSELLLAFGGIVERFNEPEDTWLLNHNEALTAHEASYDAGFLKDSLWAFDDAGATLPIHPSDYYSIAREANGNTTLCHRSTGQVILFAPDHAFDFVSPLEGCPEYTLYRIIGAESFRDWGETVAKQWLAHVKQPG